VGANGARGATPRTIAGNDEGGAMFTVLDVATVEGRRKPIARAIGVQAIRLNRFDSQPGQEGFAHDERESGQEELYLPIAGAGVQKVRHVADADRVHGEAARPDRPGQPPARGARGRPARPHGLGERP
jgi:hypothetical protein